VRSDSLVEWILRRCTSRDRAASVIGDLIELRQQKGLLWFWLSIAGAVIRLLWRPAVALVAAFYTNNWAFSIFQMTLWGVHSHHHIPDGARAALLFGILCVTSASLCLILVYAAVRYSTLDAATQLAAALAAVTTGIIYLWWQPIGLGLLLTVLTAVLVASLSSSVRWKAFTTVVAAITVADAGFLMTIYLATVWQRHLLAGPWGNREMREHPSPGWLTFFLMLTTAWLTTATYSTLRGHFMQRQSRLDSAG
jgi:hypothetical protein